MNTLRLILAASGLALLLPSVSFADLADGLDEMSPEQRREYIENLSEEDRQKLRDQKRAEWQAMSDEERRAARQRYERDREANREAIIALFDSRFYRMWTFYLAGATAAFESGGMCNYQIQFARNRHALPTTRDYMVESETLLTN